MTQRPPRNPPPVTHLHFQALRIFRSNRLLKRTSDPKQRKALWQMMCVQRQIAIIPEDTVFEAWKRYISGESRLSGIAINGDVDPHYTTLGITYRKQLTAAHTTSTRGLLKRVVGIFSRTFPNRGKFLEAAQRLCITVADETFGARDT